MQNSSAVQRISLRHGTLIWTKGLSDPTVVVPSLFGLREDSDTFTLKDMKTSKYFICVLSAFLFLTACEDEEIRDIAKAQKCLDDVPQSNPIVAEECLAYVDGHDSQQANILKCSIHLTSGGLTTAKITKAYKATKDNSVNNPSSVYIGYLALDNPTTTGYTKSLTAYSYCYRSKVSGLLFIAGLAKTGTLLASLNHGNFNLNDPSGTATAIQSILEDCLDGTLDATQCDLAEIGGTIADISDAYCASASSDKDVCDKVNSAINSANGNSEEAAKQFMCELKGGTYSGGVCS